MTDADREAALEALRELEAAKRSGGPDKILAAKLRCWLLNEVMR